MAALYIFIVTTQDFGFEIRQQRDGDDAFTYQIQHRLNYIPVANLSDLDQSNENSKFHLDIPDWNRWIDNPSRENHWTCAGHHHRLSAACSRVLPVTWRRLSVRELRHRSLACHVHPNWEASGTSYTLSPCNVLITAPEHEAEIKKKHKQNPLSVSKIHSRVAGGCARCVVGGSRLSELTDLRCAHKAGCGSVCRSLGCTSRFVLLSPPCCRPLPAVPAHTGVHSPRLRRLRWWSRRLTASESRQWVIAALHSASAAPQFKQCKFLTRTSFCSKVFL